MRGTTRGSDDGLHEDRDQGNLHPGYVFYIAGRDPITRSSPGRSPARASRRRSPSSASSTSSGHGASHAGVAAHGAGALDRVRSESTSPTCPRAPGPTTPRHTRATSGPGTEGQNRGHLASRGAGLPHAAGQGEVRPRQAAESQAHPEHHAGVPVHAPLRPGRGPHPDQPDGRGAARRAAAQQSPQGLRAHPRRDEAAASSHQAGQSWQYPLS